MSENNKLNGVVYPHCYNCGHLAEGHRSWFGACVWSTCECQRFEMNLEEGSQSDGPLMGTGLLEDVRASLVMVYEYCKTGGLPPGMSEDGFRTREERLRAILDLLSAFVQGTKAKLDEADIIWRGQWLNAFADSLNLEDVHPFLPLFLLHALGSFARRDAFASRLGVFLSMLPVGDVLEALICVETVMRTGKIGWISVTYLGKAKR